ncbi:MAG: hypothetical protein ACXWQO_15950 [Bdellovibrionota bacterium]
MHGQAQDFDILNPDDFRSIQVEIRMDNETSDTTLMRGSRAYGKLIVAEPEAGVQFLEYSANGMVLEVMHPSCDVGHTLNLDIRVTGIKIELHFTVKARVTELEHLGESRDQIKVELSSYDDLFWNAFKSVFEKRQAEITKFFSEAKG